MVEIVNITVDFMQQCVIIDFVTGYKNNNKRRRKCNYMKYLINIKRLLISFKKWSSINKQSLTHSLSYKMILIARL